jgi:methylmalonyl-CoA mutase
MATREPLAEEFPPAGEADWENLAVRGETGIAALRWRSLDGIPVGPIYPPATGAARRLDHAHGHWVIVEQVEVGATTDAAQLAATATNEGSIAKEFLFIPKSASDCRSVSSADIFSARWARIVSNDINFRRPIWLDAGLATPRILQAAGDSGTCHAICDPLAHVALGASMEDAESCFADIAALVRAGGRGRAITADGRPWHDGGATEVQELAIALASAVDSLRVLAREDIASAVAWPRLGVRLAADSDQFLTIAKFRAVRLLLARVAEVAGVSGHPLVHAVTSWRMLGAREPTMNLVRATTAAFSAATGGADAITVLSPMLDDPRLSARMARNVQLILQDESSLGRTADPGAGAGAVEDLTERMAAEAWGLFTRIESEGGLAAAIASGSIIAAVSAERDRRLDAVGRRRLPMVGINVNVDPDAPLPALPAAAQSSPGDLRLRPVRLAEPLERLADAFGHVTAGESVPVIRLGKGGDPDLADALAAVGLKARSVRTAADIPSVPLACIVVGDGGAESAAEAASSLRAADTALIVAAGTAEDTIPDWCDAIVTPGCDLVAVFSGLLDRIAERQEKEQG